MRLIISAGISKKTMKALTYLAPNVVKTIDTDTPVLDKGQALIKVHTAGICGTDMAIIAGKHPRARAPLVPGHEFSGEIVDLKLPSNTIDVNIGDRITVYPLLVCGQCWACRNGYEHVCRSLRVMGTDLNGAFAVIISFSFDAPLDKMY